MSRHSSRQIGAQMAFLFQQSSSRRPTAQVQIARISRISSFEFCQSRIQCTVCEAPPAIETMTTFYKSLVTSLFGFTRLPGLTQFCDCRILFCKTSTSCWQANSVLSPRLWPTFPSLHHCLPLFSFALQQVDCPSTSWLPPIGGAIFRGRWLVPFIQI